MKKKVVIQGTLIFPVEQGAAALIQCNDGKMIRTSRVVKVFLSNAFKAHFETLNSTYYVNMSPVPAFVQSTLRMCA